MIIMQTTICLIIMQILYSCQRYDVVIFMHIPKICWISRDHHVKCIRQCICYSIVKLLYIGKWKLIRRETWNRRTKMHISMNCHYTHWTVWLSICFIAHYYELLMLIYMSCNIDISYNCMGHDCWFYMKCNIDNCVIIENELGIYMQHI